MDGAAVSDAYIDDHLIRLGSGEPLLLVHGLGHCKEGWDPVLPALAGRFDVCALDLPGFGGAPPLPHTPDDRALATWCAAVMDVLGWDRAHIVGNSLGGLIGLHLGAAGRALSVTALSPGGQIVGWEGTYATRMLRLIKRIAPTLGTVPLLVDTDAGRRVLYGLVFGHPERLTPGYARLSAAALTRADGFDDTLDAVTLVVQDLPPPQVPTTIAWGTRDRLLFPRQGRRWHQALPGSRLVALPGLGHTPMPDDPEMVVEVVTRTAAAATKVDVAAA
ncbi:alpha/beta fold hydrolase [Euzebya tangerina]|uniref:alpha/beta fold hydrolase n=1 Tax=Euzebya tangerina TaxID=591198 RepID=UPI000E31A4DA|nr:alpha/beta hydrolase [Euzebya tangerina]